MQEFNNSKYEDEKDFAWAYWSDYITEITQMEYEPHRIFESVDMVTCYS